MKVALYDKDACVMNAALNYYYDRAKTSPDKYKHLISSIVGIQKQIIEHKLPKEYDYHRMPAPWIQIRILSILSLLGQYDQIASEGMYEVLSMTLKRADDLGLNIGYALLYQCLKTITTIYPNQGMIELASSTISRFITSDNKNLKYIGVTGLVSIVAIDSKYALRHQNVVVDCLDDSDESIKKKTLELLSRMTNNQNINAIIEKMLLFLKNSSAESSIRKDLVHKIFSLSEKFAPSREWYIRTINKLFELGGSFITPELTYNYLKLMNEWDSESENGKLKADTVNFYFDICKSSVIINDSLAQVIAWIFGEYGPSILKSEQIIDAIVILCNMLKQPFSNQITKCWLFSSICKLHSIIKFTPIQEFADVINKYKNFTFCELQQRCLEYEVIRGVPDLQLHGLLANDDNIDMELGFLDSYVEEQIAQGKAIYDPKKSLTHTLQGLKTELKVKPYTEHGQKKKFLITNKNPLITEEVHTNNELTANVPVVYKKQVEQAGPDIKELNKDEIIKPVAKSKKKNEHSKGSPSEKDILNLQLFQGIEEAQPQKIINIDAKALINQSSVVEQPSKTVNLIELDSSQQSEVKKINEIEKPQQVVPYVISIEDYKAMWLSFKNEEKIAINIKKSGEDEIKRIEHDSLMHLIQISGNQAIYAGKNIEGKAILMHVKLSDDSTECRIKSESENIDEITTLLKGLLS